MKIILFLASLCIAGAFYNMEGLTGGLFALGACGFASLFLHWFFSKL